MNKKCFIIAEVGVNHNGDEYIAYNLIDAAVKAGANAVKFQTFKSDMLVNKDTPTALYQKQNCGSNNQHAMLKKLELTKDIFKRLKQYCDKVGIEFISTPFDCDSVDVLENIGVNIYKIGSGDLTNYQLLKKVASKNKTIILSTGMSTLNEVINSVNYLKQYTSKKIILLHCISSYPTVPKDTNMLSIKTMQNKFKNIDIGFSDHTHGNHAAIIAVSLGAQYIEKHFTLDKNMKGPDHNVSLTPKELIKYINAIRTTEIMLGNGIKQCMHSEQNTKNLVRRSIAINKNLQKGNILAESDLICLRPNNNISSIEYENIIGKKLLVNINKFEFLTYDIIN